MTPLAPARDMAGTVGCLLLVALGVAAIVYSRDFSALGAVFPRTIAGVMIGLGALYTVLALAGRTRAIEPEGGSRMRRWGVALVMLGWAFTLERLGFLASSIIAMVLLLVIANHDGWSARRVAVYGLVTAAVLGALYGVFGVALQVPLPRGWFG